MRGACTAAERLLSRALDEPLARPVMATLQRHLDGCPSCRRLLAVFAQERLLLGELAGHEGG